MDFVLLWCGGNKRLYSQYFVWSRRRYTFSHTETASLVIFFFFKSRDIFCTTLSCTLDRKAFNVAHVVRNPHYPKIAVLGQIVGSRCTAKTRLVLGQKLSAAVANIGVFGVEWDKYAYMLSPTLCVIHNFVLLFKV